MCTDAVYVSLKWKIFRCIDCSCFSYTYICQTLVLLFHSCEAKLYVYKDHIKILICVPKAPTNLYYSELTITINSLTTA